MRHVRLGRTGLKVTPICLGTITFGRQADEDAAHAIMGRAALDSCDEVSAAMDYADGPFQR